MDSALMTMFRECAQRGWNVRVGMWLPCHEDAEECDIGAKMDTDNPQFVVTIDVDMYNTGIGLVPAEPDGRSAGNPTLQSSVNVGIGRSEGDPVTAFRAAIARAEEVLAWYARGTFVWPDEPVDAVIRPVEDDPDFPFSEN